MSNVATKMRRLDRAGAPSLEIIEASPGAAGLSAPLLLVHGAFAGAWSWRERFLGLLAERGRSAAAVSLRGHGSSEGRRDLHLATIEDFVADVRAAIEAMPAPPVVVGHSLGGYLAQLLLGAVPVKALVLMSSLPPDGLALVGPRLAFSDPLFWAEGVLGSAGHYKDPDQLAALDLLFGPGISLEDRQRFARQMVPESALALGQTHLPRWVLPAQAARIPALVMRGTEDRMIWEGTALRTAIYHGAEMIRVPGGSHLFILDSTAPQAARLLLDWLTRNRL